MNKVLILITFYMSIITRFFLWRTHNTDHIEYFLWKISCLLVGKSFKQILYSFLHFSCDFTWLWKLFRSQNSWLVFPRPSQSKNLVSMTELVDGTSRGLPQKDLNQIWMRINLYQSIIVVPQFNYVMLSLLGKSVISTIWNG